MALTPENIEARFRAIETEIIDSTKKLNDQLVPAIQQLNDVQNAIASEAANRQAAINAAIDGVQINLNKVQADAFARTEQESQNWKTADAAYKADIASIKVVIESQGIQLAHHLKNITDILKEMDNHKTLIVS